MVRRLPSYTQMISFSPAPQGHGSSDSNIFNSSKYIKFFAITTSLILLLFWASILFCFRPISYTPSWIVFQCRYSPEEPVFTMPQECPTNYADYAKVFHEPGSGGPLNLPFQRPFESCRKFTSDVINTVIDTISSKMANVDLARLFTNAFPNTLDTTIQGTACLNNQTTASDCHPLAFIITGDINAMWLRDSANQLMPYLEYINQDWNLKRLFLGAIYMQAQFIQLDPYANAFNEPGSLSTMASDSCGSSNLLRRQVFMSDGVYERKWEVDSLASFLSLSYNYWSTTGDDSFVESTIWLDAVDAVIKTVKEQQEPTFDPATGKPLDTFYTFSQRTDRPTETQFLNGRGNPVKRTGMVKSLFRPSDDATIYPFFIPGNAMISVELGHVSQILAKTAEKGGSKLQSRMQVMANETQTLSKEIRDAIFTYGITNVPGYGKVFAYEVDGYGSTLIMDDANVPSLLSLSMIGFIDPMDPIYQNTRRLVLSRDNPYYFSGPRSRGIGGPHVDLDYAWPMSQIVTILSSSNDTEIKEALDIILHSTDGTGLIHESVNVYDDDKEKYTRPWFAWANGLFGQAILKIAKERPYLIFKE